MNNSDLSKLKYLLSHIFIDNDVIYGIIKPIDFFNDRSKYDKYKDILNIININNIDNDELLILIKSSIQEYKVFKKLMKTNTCKINRDNKNDYNNGSEYQGNVIRYPKKNRTLKTWRNFYKLFPKRAELMVLMVQLQKE